MVSLQHLQMYLAQGKKLFPCNPHNKRPLTQHGFKDASDDINSIAAWHQKYKDCAWGTPTASQYAVVDIDPRNGGDATWKNLISQHGDLNRNTPTVETGSGGLH